MSMYNMIFGQNPFSDLLLAMVNLTKADCGRYRDCYLEDGKIALYTRNGGGNRECWHADSPEFGSPTCKHHTIEVEVDETVELPYDRDNPVLPEGYTWGNCFMGSKRSARTGRRIMVTRYVCENPDSADCHCYGCFMTYHVHKLPYYSHDKDDSFDSTYATIYFNVPDQYKDALANIPAGDENRDDAWQSFFEKLRAGDNTDANVANANTHVAPLVEALVAQMGAKA